MGARYPRHGKTRLGLHYPAVTMLQTARHSLMCFVNTLVIGHGAEPGPDDGQPARTPAPATAVAFHFLKLVNKIFYIKIIHSAELVCSTVGAGRWLNTATGGRL